MNRILRISYDDDSSGGGVYFYLKDFLNIQKKAGIDCYWIRHDKIWAFWAFFTAVLFSIRWVFLGFKKTASARNWPEGSDQ